MNKNKKQGEWHLYIIKCNNGTFYTGITLDVQRRFEEHSAEGPKSAKYVKGKGPLTLIFSAPVGQKGRAYQMEKKVKRLSKKKKIDLVAGIFTLDDLE